MMPWKTWLVRLGVAGALVMVAGCGSSDIPDPGSDSAAAEAPSDGGGPPVVAAPAPAPAAETQVAAEEGAGKSEEPKPEEAPAEAASPPTGSNAGVDKNSATAEMLAMATTAPPGANTNSPDNGESASGGGAGPGGGQGAPGGGGGMAEMQRRMAQGGRAQAGGPGMGMMGPGGGGAGGPNPGDMAKMREQMQASMRNRGGGPGGPGMPGGPGARGGPGGGKDKEPDFHDPRKAVQAFLDAVKDKDLDALTEATALRAQVEASAKNREIFKRIYDGSLSEAELDDLASKLEGFKVASENPAHSTARVQVVIQKTDKKQNARITRLITVRHEKSGWKVCDVSGPGVYKNPAMMRRSGQPKFGGSKNN